MKILLKKILFPHVIDRDIPTAILICKLRITKIWKYTYPTF